MSPRRRQSHDHKPGSSAHASALSAAATACSRSTTRRWRHRVDINRALSWLSPARRLRRAAGRHCLASAGCGAAAEHGAGVGAAAAERAGRKCRWGGSDGLCQWRTPCAKRAGDRLLPRFPAGNLSLHRTALRNARQPRRHVAARTGDAGLRSGPSGTQLGNGFDRRRRQFCRADNVTAGSAGIYADDEGSRPALNGEGDKNVREPWAVRFARRNHGEPLIMVPIVVPTILAALLFGWWYRFTSSRALLSPARSNLSPGPLPLLTIMLVG